MDIPEGVQKNSGFISVVLTTFTTIFLAELGDKTQIATLMFSAQSGKPLIVFFGAASALILSSLIGVLLGRWISTTIPEKSFTLSAALLMILVGVLYGFEGIQELFTYIKQI